MQVACTHLVQVVLLQSFATSTDLWNVAHATTGNGEPKMPPPRPQPRVSIPAHEVSQSYAVEPSEPIPMKPERQKGKKAPPKPPTPYEVAKKVI